MKEFRLSANITISVYTTVFAETLEEAIQIAEEERAPMSIVSNGGDSEETNWMCDELDGDAYNIVQS